MSNKALVIASLLLVAMAAIIIASSRVDTGGPADPDTWWRMQQ